MAHWRGKKFLYQSPKKKNVKYIHISGPDIDSYIANPLWMILIISCYVKCNILSLKLLNLL